MSKLNYPIPGQTYTEDKYGQLGQIFEIEGKRYCFVKVATQIKLFYGCALYVDDTYEAKLHPAGVTAETKGYKTINAIGVNYMSVPSSTTYYTLVMVDGQIDFAIGDQAAGVLVVDMPVIGDAVYNTNEAGHCQAGVVASTNTAAALLNWYDDMQTGRWLIAKTTGTSGGVSLTGTWSVVAGSLNILRDAGTTGVLTTEVKPGMKLILDTSGTPQYVYIQEILDDHTAILVANATAFAGGTVKKCYAKGFINVR